MDTQHHSRRRFLKSLAIGTAAIPFFNPAFGEISAKNKMKFGLVTYLWAKDWDLPTLISNCEKSKVYGVELRVEHAHGVEPHLSKAQRLEVKKRFKDSKVVNLGPGTNWQYDSPNPTELKKNIDGTKEHIILSHDIGSSGVKVKPNQFHKGVPKEKTIEQIGKSLNEVGKFAADHGQVIRLEVHGNETQELPNIKAIMDVADHKSVFVCWNSNDQDLMGQGLEYNFNLVKDRLGDTVHVRELNIGNYPYQHLINLFVKMNYDGWILLEARTEPADKVQALIEQRQVLESMIQNASRT
jgi:sugar phosphate isomerase/epimerase